MQIPPRTTNAPTEMRIITIGLNTDVSLRAELLVEVGGNETSGVVPEEALVILGD